MTNTPTAVVHSERTGLGRDFQRYWQAYAVSTAGSALAAGVLPMIAIFALDASVLQVSLLAAVGSVTAAILALPLGVYIDRADKRSVLIRTDLVQFAVVASIPLAAAFGVLTFLHLCLVAVVQTTCAIAASSAAFAFVKQTVEPASRTLATSRTDTVMWTTQTLGPPAGGALVGVLGTAATLIADAVSYLVSALILRGVRPVPPPSGTSREARWSWRELFAGWELLLREPALRALYVNAMVFGGAITWSMPLIAILLLGQSGASALQYGIALGVAGLGGLIGAWLSPKVTARLGDRNALLVSGLARTPWLLVLPFAGSGWTGVAVISGAQFCLLMTAGIFNPVFSARRMSLTPDHLVARVSASWSVTARLVQPLFITAGGLLATALTVRGSLVAAGVLCAASAAFLPWRRPESSR
ncbi:MFS transporter [Longispora albida]|uniref:MFS transporter n=1 Tax=Longispora albida TaxID=203523 RepID=UPI00036869A3|nr:MFS transporter [Longispora albida]